MWLYPMIGWNYQRYWESPEVEGDYEMGHRLQPFMATLYENAAVSIEMAEN